MMMPFWLSRSTIEVRVDLDEVLVVALDHVVDRHRDRVRQLVGDALERGLADELGDALDDVLVGERLGRVERRAPRPA